MGMMEGSLTTLAPLLLRNLATSFFIYADQSLLSLSQRYKLLQCLRFMLVTSFLFFLRFLPSSLNPSPQDDADVDDDDCNPDYNKSNLHYHQLISNTKSSNNDSCVVPAANSGVARALTQLLSIVNQIPVSSRKYQVVRSLAETIILDNHRENVEALHQVNRTVLSAAFTKTLAQLEAAMLLVARGPADEDDGSLTGPVKGSLNKVFKAVRSVRDRGTSWVLSGRANGDGLRRSSRGGGGGGGSSAEKLAAELLWLAEELVACECGEEAVWRWASASNLAWLGLSADPRLQGYLVKVSAFLFKQANEMGIGETEEAKKEQQRQTKMKMLMSWLPLLCRASTGTDAPVLSMNQRVGLERVLEEMVETLEQEEEQEQVLSLWLQHFTSCPSSDWPNLHASYARWCSASRKLLLLNSPHGHPNKN